ncbi:MAG: F0F1 ATP synthase subunit B [Chthoniobacterales bacterium]
MQASDVLTIFGFSWARVLAQCILFLIVYLVLNRYAFGPIITMLEERRRRIEEGQVNAEKIKKQLAEAELRYQEILRKANDEAQKLIEEARGVTEVQTQKQLQQAIKDAEGIITKANASIVLEHQRMVDEVKKEMVGLVVNTTARVAGKVLTADDQKRLSEETSRELASAK